MIGLLALLCSLLPATPGARAEAPGRCCITDPAGWYRDTPANIERRFALYREIGVDTLRVEVDWRTCEPEEGRWDSRYLDDYLALARRHGFRIKLIVGALMAPPKWFLDKHPEARILDENGRWSTNTLSFWYPGLRALVDDTTRRLLQVVRDHRLMERVDFVIPALGPAGEPIYPVPWTLGTDAPQTYWCYDENAQRDFRARMRRKYGRLDRANARWKTTFATWETVRVLPPGTRPGPYWEDVLLWYRDAKRDFIRRAVDDLRKRAGPGPKVLLYVPGTAYSDAQWREAVRTARGSDPVMMMADSRFLMDVAAEKGCWLQYTGCENAPEVAALRQHLDARGERDVEMWGENAGVWEAARDPLRLSDIVLDNRLYGLDFTHAHWIFESDRVTPNAVFSKLKEAFARIREARPAP